MALGREGGRKGVWRENKKKSSLPEEIYWKSSESGSNCFQNGG